MHSSVSTQASKAKTDASHLFGLSIDGLLSTCSIKKDSKIPSKLIVLGSKTTDKKVDTVLSEILSEWQIEAFKNSKSGLYVGDSVGGPVAIVRTRINRANNHDGVLSDSLYGKCEAGVGGAFASLMDKVKSLAVVAVNCQEEELVGALAGIEIANYRYKRAVSSSSCPINTIELVGFDKKIVAKAAAIGVSTNVARHLVNLPPADLNPKTYSEAMKKIFAQDKSFSVDVWGHKRLQKENMGLFLAVGQAASEAPCMVHIKYRPAGSSSKKPIALVGKGVTFDSGGLNIKPGQYMRLMKKDMGGSASCVGVAWWLKMSKTKQPFDIYLGLAENSCDGDAFHPGDVLTSRKGITVEIDNTDAEGRLVLADTLDVATSKKGKDAPQCVIDIATLTGAARVAMGLDIGVMFATDDRLSKKLLSAGQKRGDRCWRMPLYDGYDSLLSTQFADVNHCSTAPHGGAITAALFLKKFVGEIPWVHFDVMAWATKPKGAIREVGGNGQVVRLLSQFVEQLK